MKLVKIVWLFIIFIWGSPVFSQNEQTDFPISVLPRQSFDVPANFDTLWVLKNSQYKKAIKIALKLEIDSTLVVLLEQKHIKLWEIISAKDSIIVLTKEGYIHYRDLWEETDRALEEAEIKAASRWRFVTIGFYVGTILTGLTAGVLALAL